MCGQFLPLAIFVGLQSIEAGVFADNLVHAFVCSTGPRLLQQALSSFKPRLLIDP